jgi:hypothetical protein
MFSRRYILLMSDCDIYSRVALPILKLEAMLIIILRNCLFVYLFISELFE